MLTMAIQDERLCRRMFLFVKIRYVLRGRQTFDVHSFVVYSYVHIAVTVFIHACISNLDLCFKRFIDFIVATDYTAVIANFLYCYKNLRNEFVYLYYDYESDQ